MIKSFRKNKYLKNCLTIALMCFSLCMASQSLSAQKAVRKAVRDGNKAYKDQLYGNAEEKFKNAQKENQASKEASFNLANTYYKQQKWDEALKEYQHYLTLENQNPTKVSGAWANVGNTYLKKKANEKGEQAQQPPQQGQQQQKLNNLQLSMEAYKMALRNNPNDEKVRYNLAVVQKMIQDQKSDGGGGQDNKDQDNKDQDKKDKKDQDKKDQDKKDQDNKDQKQDDKKQEQHQDKNGMSEQNMQQILNAIEQDERETQQRVKEAQAQERKEKSQRNKQQNKDW